MEFVVILLGILASSVYGIVCFIRNVTAHDKIERNRRIDELEWKKRVLEKHREHPDLPVEELLDRLDPLPDVVIRTGQPSAVKEKGSVPASTVGEAGKSSVISRWYADNSINLLLYIGAFLIVVSASLLVGFQWNTMDNLVKSGLLLLTAAAFLACGFVFFRIRTIRSAGAAFMGIGNLLVPFVGYGIYLFMFRSVVPGWQVWITTSIVSTLLSVGIGLIVREKAYVYLATFGLVSFVLGIVNISSVENVYYVLGAELSAFLLFVSSVFLKKYRKDDFDFFAAPMRLSSAGVIMPLSAAVWVYTAMLSKDMTGSLTACVVLAALFYGVVYGFERERWQSLLTEILYFAGVSVWLACIHSTPALHSAVMGCAVSISLIVGMIGRMKRPRNRLSEPVVVIALFLGIIEYVFHLDQTGNPLMLSLLALLVWIGIIVWTALNESVIVKYVAVFWWFVWYGNILMVSRLPVRFFPYAFSVAAYITFAVSVFEKDRWQTALRRVSYVAVVAAAYVLTWPMGLVRWFVIPGSIWEPTQEGTLIGMSSLWLASAFFAVEGLRRQRTKYYYVAGFVFMCAITWYLMFSEVHRQLAYTFPWGVYWLAVSFFRRWEKDNRTDIYDLIGVGMLTVVNFFVMFDEAESLSAIMIGCVGLGLFFVGISLKRKIYSWPGLFAFMAAVLAKTYRYVLGMEKWMATAVLGMMFLVGAVILLMRRTGSGKPPSTTSVP